jgi:hypothetical protein
VPALAGAELAQQAGGGVVGDVELGAERVPGDGLAVLLVLGDARRFLTAWDKHSARPAGTPASLSAGSPSRRGSPKATPAVSRTAAVRSPPTSRRPTTGYS